MTTTFYTPNPIPIEALTTFGVSAKECDNPIGYFGTGFKYATAVILRAGGRVTVHNGPDTYAFSARPKEIRGQSFNIIHMNDQPLSFTTDLGKNWEMWMAFRELYSNTLDEGGTMKKGRSPYRVVVDCPEFERVKLEDVFLTSEPPLTTPTAPVP